MLHLHNLAKQGEFSKVLTINERLPSFLPAPCNLDVNYKVELKDKYFLVRLNVVADLTIACQRCMNDFVFHYDNETEIAVCRNDERAEQLLEQYECIVAANDQVELEDLVIDELHLYVPIFHPVIDDCDNEVNRFLTEKNETY